MFKKYLLFVFICPLLIIAQTSWYIHDGVSNGNGSLGNPFNSWSSAMSALEAGDTLFIMPGIYNISSFIYPVNSGNANERITVKAYDLNNRPIIKSAPNGCVRTSDISHYTWEGIDFDGDFGNGNNRLFELRVNSDNFTFTNCNFYESSVSAISIIESDNTVVDSCEIYYCVNYYSPGVRRDAHGIIFYSGNKLTVNNCNIHHNTGDCIQSGTSLNFPSWDTLIITNCHLWSGMVDSVVNTMPANTFWSENGIDTKTPDSATIASTDPDWMAYLYTDNNVLHGFNGDYDWPAIAINMAVNATIKNTVVYESAIGYRLMGPYIHAQTHTKTKGPAIKMINCISYDTYWAALWPENNVDSLRIWNCTFDNSIDTLWWPGIHVRAPSYFDNRVNFNEESFDMRNTIFVDTMPPELIGIVDSTVFIADSSDFVDYENHDYHLSSSSRAINIGSNIPDAAFDFDGNPRIIDQYDVGAFEYSDSSGIEKPEKIDYKLILEQNHPNPFKRTTTIKYSLPADMQAMSSMSVQLKVYNVLGQEAAILVNEMQPAGNYEVEFDGSNLASGIYIYSLKTNRGLTATKKLLLLK